jgi:uncharacterized protein YceH (UPF0502 family)
LEVPPKAVALLAELLLRGPQTDGELRQRINRMIPLESLEEVAGIIDELSTGPSPLVRRLTPPERRRGARFAHTLYPDSEEPAAEEGGDETPPVPDRHSSGSESRPAPLASDLGAREAWLASERAPVASVEREADAPAPRVSETASPSGSLTISDLVQRIRSLEDRVEELEATFVRFLR